MVVLALKVMDPQLSAPESPTRAHKLRWDHKYERSDRRAWVTVGVNNVLKYHIYGLIE